MLVLNLAFLCGGSLLFVFVFVFSVFFEQIGQDVFQERLPKNRGSLDRCVQAACSTFS